MDAYKLADELQDLHGLYCEDAANMLRQQADRIAELEDRLSMYEIKDLDRGIIGRTKDYVIHDLVHRTTPQIKELSDKEIQEISHDFGEIAWLGETTYNFARAILKKANEK